LGFPDCPKSYAFKGAKEYTAQQIQDQLGIAVRNDPRGASASGGSFKRFLLPISECEFTLNSILDDLQCDPWVAPGDERYQRATGTALNVAISLLEACPFQVNLEIKE
jgi:protein transport protein SEC23